jgi:hypothetical protein
MIEARPARIDSDCYQIGAKARIRAHAARAPLKTKVERTPWSAADALVGLVRNRRRQKSGSRGTRADQGVRPTGRLHHLFW